MVVAIRVQPIAYCRDRSGDSLAFKNTPGMSRVGVGSFRRTCFLVGTDSDARKDI